MLELYQAEWCPHSRKVRMRLTELGVPFVARQVPVERAEREEMRRATGSDEIPALVAEDGTPVTGHDHELVAWLDAHYPEPPEAEVHRRKAEEEAG